MVKLSLIADDTYEVQEESTLPTPDLIAPPVITETPRAERPRRERRQHPDQQLQEVERRIQELERKISDLEHAIAPSAETHTNIEAALHALEALHRRISRLRFNGARGIAAEIASIMEMIKENQ